MAKYKKRGRIQQKVDTYDNWEANKPDILAGEICVATNCPEHDIDEVMIKIPRKDANWEDVPWFKADGGGSSESLWSRSADDSLKPRCKGHIYVNSPVDMHASENIFAIDTMVPYVETIEYDANGEPTNAGSKISQYTIAADVVRALEKMTHTTKDTQAYANATAFYNGMYIKIIEHSSHKKEIVSNVMLLDSDGNVVVSNVNIQNNDLSDPDLKPTVAVLIAPSLSEQDRIAKIIIS